MGNTLLLNIFVALLLSHLVVSDSLVTSMTVAHQALLSMGFPGQEYWSGLPFPSLGDLPDPGIKSSSCALACRFFAIEPPGKPLITDRSWENGFPGSYMAVVMKRALGG